MNGMMRYWRTLALFSCVLLCRDLTANIFYSTANADRNNTQNLTNSNVNAYQSTTYTFTRPSHELRGLFMLKDGFTINSGVTACWNAEGVVDGPMIFAATSSILTLSTSMRLGPKGQFATTDHKVTASANAFFLGGNDARLTTTMRNYSSLRINGSGYVFTIQPTSGGVNPGGEFFFTTPTDNTCRLNEMVLACGKGSARGAIFNSPTHISNSIILSAPPDGQYTKFGAGSSYSLTITGDVRIEGFGTRFDNGSRPITIGRNSMLSVGPGIALTGVSSLTMTDTTSVLHLDGCDFYVGSSGVQMNRGTLIFDGKVRILNINYGGDPLSPNTVMANGFVLGSGAGFAGQDVNVMVRGGASVIVAGAMHYNHA